jgi:hypothetical protein
MMDWLTILGRSRRAPGISAIGRSCTRPARRRAGLGLVASAAILAVNAAPAGTLRADNAGHAAALISVAAQSAGPIAPRLLTAGRLHPRAGPGPLEQPGTVVSASNLFSNRVFVNANVGFALANGNNAQYPVVSTDGGRQWRIDGPQVHVDAADGPEAVQFVGITGPRTYFVYGSSVVDVTTDGGRVWWETLLGEEVMAVVPSSADVLVAYVEQSVSNQHLNPAVTWQYISRDGGRHWRYSTSFGGLSG